MHMSWSCSLYVCLDVPGEVVSADIASHETGCDYRQQIRLYEMKGIKL